MEQVAHQTIVMQFILELAKSLKVDPRGCFRQFFEKIKVNNCVWMLQNLKRSRSLGGTNLGKSLFYSPVCISFKSEEQGKLVQYIHIEMWKRSSRLLKISDLKKKKYITAVR